MKGGKRNKSDRLIDYFLEGYATTKSIERIKVGMPHMGGEHYRKL